MTPQKTLGRICLCVLAITLIAGLWPFHVPANHVNWLKNGNGLAFARYSSAMTSGAFPSGGVATADGTLEIWLEANGTVGYSTLLSFDGSSHPGEPFSLHQRGDALGIRRNNVDDHGTSRTALVYIARVFKKNTPAFLSITFDDQQMSIYVNGMLAKTFPLTGAWNDLTGRLVLANSLTVSDSWCGRLLGLAIYRQQLTASQVAENYGSWVATGRPKPAFEASASALYLFDEHGGPVAHNRLDPATNLAIPKRYFVLHPHFLRAPWKEYHPDWKDIGINIAGLVPFGFFVCAYLRAAQVVRYPWLTTIILGLFTSLLIEILQAFLPTRSSDLTDVITNTLGTVFGVMLYSNSDLFFVLPERQEELRLV